MKITLRVNGTARQVEIAPADSLLNVLRDTLDLTGTKYGCGEGQCGACTVVADGQAIKSCQTKAAQAEGRAITTIEGLERNGRLHPVQEAFLEHEAMQCGYCTPGMIMRAHRLLQENPSPTEEEIRHGISGNICRCTGYQNIVKAISAAAGTMANLKKKEAAE
jgi:carbon-monoxide dehydrogenase small subunit